MNLMARLPSNNQASGNCGKPGKTRFDSFSMFQGGTDFSPAMVHFGTLPETDSSHFRSCDLADGL
jgi:hypothetical protein